MINNNIIYCNIFVKAIIAEAKLGSAIKGDLINCYILFRGDCMHSQLLVMI